MSPTVGSSIYELIYFVGVVIYSLHRQPKHLMNFLLVELGTRWALFSTQSCVNISCLVLHWMAHNNLSSRESFNRNKSRQYWEDILVSIPPIYAQHKWLSWLPILFHVEEYVTCHTCRSPETNLHKETRLFFLQCETCGSRCSVQNIKSGFQAVTGKRAQMRSKAQWPPSYYTCTINIVL